MYPISGHVIRAKVNAQTALKWLKSTVLFIYYLFIINNCKKN